MNKGKTAHKAPRFIGFLFVCLIGMGSISCLFSSQSAAPASETTIPIETIIGMTFSAAGTQTAVSYSSTPATATPASTATLLPTITLQPTLTFQVVPTSAPPPTNTETTQPQTNAVIFAVIGDYGIAGQPAADVAKLVKSWDPNFIVTVGDNNYPDGVLSSIDQNIGQYYHDYIYKYSGKYGNGSDTRRFFPALGNHDWHDGEAKAHIKYFNLPGNERFYSFAYGPVHFFILDSIKHEEAGNTATSTQGKWLQKELSASTSPFNVVVTHYAPYSSGEHGEVPFMQWPFTKWGADVVLAGHDHDYERLFVDGIPYFVNGAGGDDLSGFRSAILPQSVVQYNADFGAMRVEAAETYMKFQFITRRNLVVDEYILSQQD